MEFKKAPQMKIKYLFYELFNIGIYLKRWEWGEVVCFQEKKQTCHKGACNTTLKRHKNSSYPLPIKKIRYITDHKDARETINLYTNIQSKSASCLMRESSSAAH